MVVPVRPKQQFENSKDFEGKVAFNSIFGEMQVGFKQDNISINFHYNNSDRDVTETASGTGTVSNADSLADLSTGTGVGLASLVSVDAVRYRPGHECLAMFTSAVLGTIDSNIITKHGILNGENGLAFGYQGTSFGVYFIEDTNETFTAQTDWNVDKLDGSGESGFILDASKLNIFKISYGWLGISPIYFSIYGGAELSWIHCHTIDLVNTQEIPHIKNPSLPITATVERTAGTGADVSLHTSSWRAGVIGAEREDNSSNRWFSHTELEFVVVGGSEVPIFTIKNKSTFQGKTNHVRAELGVVRFTTDLNKPAALYGIINGTLGGPTSFVDKDTDNSVMQVDNLSTSITGGSRGPATVLGKSDAERSDLIGTGINIYPGQTFTLTIDAPVGSTGTVSGSFRWIEYF